MVGKSTDNFAVLGDQFLNHFYSVFDYEKKEVKLAINKHSRGKVEIKN